MGGASAVSSVGAGYVVGAKDPLVFVRPNGSEFHVCKRSSKRERWAEIVAVTKSKRLANEILGFLSLSPHALPLPIVHEVREVYDHSDPTAMDHVGSFVLVAPDPMAGRKGDYSVIRVDFQTGRATCIGRELPLALSRKIAKRPASEDGKPT